MIEIELNDIIGDIEKFFKENSYAIKMFHNGNHNLSIDGSGCTTSVNARNAARIADYLTKKFRYKDVIKVLDIGTGVGHLINAMSTYGINGFGVEGSKYPVEASVCPKDRIAVMDLTKKITDKVLFKCANLTTSFEVFEHVHRIHEDIFLRNLAYLADYHLCSINMDEWPGTSNTHCNIKHMCCWLELFRKHNIKCTITYPATTHHTDRNYTECVGIPTSFNKNYDYNEDIGLDWTNSMFCLLDMRDCNVT